MQASAWWRNTPLPRFEDPTSLAFQPWYRFDSCSNKWASFDPERVMTNKSDTGLRRETALPAHQRRLVLVTWNVDAGSPASERRISAIISHIQTLFPAVDVLLLQEVSHQALAALLETPWIRDNWFCSEADTSNWGKQPFASMALVSKLCCGTLDCADGKAILGPAWRVKLPSRFGRDALCFDILVPSGNRKSSEPGKHTRVRLVNVHLDSLPIQPSLRPRQFSIINSYLTVAGRGLIAGDFNSVLPEDNILVYKNNLVDLWTQLHPTSPGFTWGVDGKQRFPPNRLDKVAALGLEAHEIAVISPGIIRDQTKRNQLQQPKTSQEQMTTQDLPLAWSDHHGLICSLSLLETQNAC